MGSFLGCLAMGICLFWLPACSNDSAQIPRIDTRVPTLSYKGYEIPRFPTARGQLNYARSWFATKQEKRAALTIIPTLFPQDRIQCGNAALTLAYMNLGDDYRFATPADFLKALSDYKKVVTAYGDQPVIQAKAHWYIGWILCECLDRPAQGMVHFNIIVTRFPRIFMEISPPVPWVSLVYPTPTARTKRATPSPKKYWAGIALLEMICHAPDPDQAIQAFDTLFDKYPDSVETGFALKLMLKTPRLSSHALARKTGVPWS